MSNELIVVLSIAGLIGVIAWGLAYSDDDDDDINGGGYGC